MINVEILSCDSSRSYEAEAVFLPGVLGEFEVLDQHAPIISALTGGRIRIRTFSGMEDIVIKGGIVHYKGGVMKICVEE